MVEGSESVQTQVIIPAEWAEAAHSVAASFSQSSVTVICGPKNSGKSTFSRFLLNTLLQRYEKVGYLDADVGQPEFSPPGCISLTFVTEIVADLSEPCLREPERHFFFGDISSKRNPKAYLDCIFNLYDYYMKEYSSPTKAIIPLIINTPGWVKGLGYDVLVQLLRYTSPTRVVCIRIPVKSKNLPTGTFWTEGEIETGSDLITISSAHQHSSDQLSIQKSARDKRELRLFNYFKRCFRSELKITTNKELAFLLASLPPYEVSCSKIKVRHLHCQVPTAEVWHSLNATVVGLAVHSDCSANSEDYIPCCVGLGIVRGIDLVKGLLYVITPVPLRVLQKVNLILQGFVEIPTGLLQVRGYVSPYMSTNVLHKILEREL